MREIYLKIHYTALMPPPPSHQHIAHLMTAICDDGAQISEYEYFPINNYFIDKANELSTIIISPGMCDVYSIRIYYV